MPDKLCKVLSPQEVTPRKLIVSMSFRLVDRIANQIARCYLSTKHQIYLIAFFSYIWDAMRKGYLESCKKEYEEYNSRSMVRQRLERYRALKAHEGDIVYGIGHMERSYSQYEKKIELDNLMTEKFGCPLPELPKYIRIYQIFSTVYTIYSFVKYGLVSSIYYGWLGIDQIYACYLPGRIGVVTDIAHEVPLFGFLLFSFHIVYRVVWYLAINRIDVEGLMFLCYDRETVLNKQYEVLELNVSQIAPEIAYRKYLCNKIFYKRHMDNLGRSLYTLKPHRSIGHYDQLERVAAKLCLSHYFVLFGLFIPFLFSGFSTQVSHEFFDRSYPACRSFSHDPENENFRWSFEDRFRLCYLFFDLFDNLMFFLDTAGAFSVPFSGALIAAHDLNLRFDALNERITCFIDKLRLILFDNYYHLEDEQQSDSSPMAQIPITKRLIEDLEKESNLIFNETIDTFGQVQKVDEYLKGYGIISISVLFMGNMSFQAFTLFRVNTIAETTVIIYRYTQANMNAILLSVFAMIARTHTKTQISYNKLCSAMALYPTIYQTKTSWRWLLEYYHKGSSRCTFHFISKAYALSNLNILRCASWFVTCTVIILNLLRR